MPSFIVICSEGCGGSYRCYSHQRCEMISGFYFGLLESLEDVLALCLSSVRLVTFEPSANYFIVFLIKLLYMIMHFMCDMSYFYFTLLLFLVENIHVDTFLWTRKHNSNILWKTYSSAHTKASFLLIGLLRV